MHTLTVKSFSYSGSVDHRIHESITHFSHEFSFGKSYLLGAELGKGAWALCCFIGGLLKLKKPPYSDYGEILSDGAPYSQEARLRDSWFVRRSEFMGFRAGHRTVKSYIQRGLKSNPNPYLSSEQDYIDRFFLTYPQRYDRPVRQLSHEGWRASAAIGLAHGKKIFCFPYVEYVRPYLIEEYFDLWLKTMVDLLRDSGALVLIPALATDLTRKLCDEVVPIRRPL